MKTQILSQTKRLFLFWLKTFLNKSKKPSGRELTIFVFVIMTIISWIAEQFLSKPIPEWMFLSFIGLIAAGLGLYTLEKPNK
jgi:hypothetical protein